MIKRKATPKDYPAILNLWEKSVLATHDFLTDKDRVAIKQEIPTYFPELDIQLWYIEDTLIGYSALHNQGLEMLFLDPDHTGKGYGKQILTSLITNYAVNAVDVNKDNTYATRFYLNNGFFVESESELDNAGRPYPILYLKLQ